MKRFRPPRRSARRSRRFSSCNGTLYVGLAWNNHIEPSGVYASDLGGGFMTFKPFGAGHTGLIVWTLSYDPLNGVLYAGTEILDHPQPNVPPFFRSANGGANWSNVNQFGALPWHVVDSAVRPVDGYLLPAATKRAH